MNLYEYAVGLPLSHLDPSGSINWAPTAVVQNRDFPWGSGGPVGTLYSAKTDAGTVIHIWKPADGTTYWCHGFTFGGSTAAGGPYSIYGNEVPTVLSGDGWKQTLSCMAQAGDIVVFSRDGNVTHSGILRKVAAPGGKLDETGTMVESKPGQGPLNTISFSANASQYGKYRIYSKHPLQGCCAGEGQNEAPRGDAAPAPRPPASPPAPPPPPPSPPPPPRRPAGWHIPPLFPEPPEWLHNWWQLIPGVLPWA